MWLSLDTEIKTRCYIQRKKFPFRAGNKAARDREGFLKEELIHLEIEEWLEFILATR